MEPSVKCEMFLLLIVGQKRDIWWRKERDIIKFLICALKAPSCSYRDSDSGLGGVFEPIWSPFQGVPSTTVWGGATSEHSQGWAAHYSEREPIHWWVNLITVQPFLLGTCLPHFLSTGSNLARAQLDEMLQEEAKESRSQNHPGAKAQPACPSWDTDFCSRRDESNERPVCSISKFESGIRPG